MTPERRVTAWQLFWGFSWTALRSFGGVLPWARRLIVEERSWLSASEFTDVLSLCQFLPGPNIVNVSVVVGRRFAGARGALAAVLGLLLLPTLITVAAAILFERVADLPLVSAAFRGLAAAAAGTTLALGLKMIVALRKVRVSLLFSGLAFLAVALLRWPLLLAMLGLAPLSVLAQARLGGRR